MKFHFRTQQGIANLTDAEAEAVVAKDRESHGRDLLTAIDGGNFPRWTLLIQVMTEDQAKTHKHNPFDLTKVWPKRDYPLIEVGVMELNRYPDNYFAEVEQAAFSPANVVPGIGFSPDKMLQWRLFSYGDTQRYRLGVNFNQIPVNAPKCPFQSYHRDGQMRIDGNLGATLAFIPTARTYGQTTRFAEPPMPVDGDAAHWDHRVDDDHWEQPGNLFRLMTPEQQQALFGNTARAMGDAPPTSRSGMLRIAASRPSLWRGCGSGVGHGDPAAGRSAIADTNMAPTPANCRCASPSGSAKASVLCRDRWQNGEQAHMQFRTKASN